MHGRHLPKRARELSLAGDFSPALFFARDEVLAILERYVRAEPLPEV